MSTSLSCMMASWNIRPLMNIKKSNSHSTLFLTPRSQTLLSFPLFNNLTPLSNCFVHSSLSGKHSVVQKKVIRRNRENFGSRNIRASAAAGEESLDSETTAQETFSWSSVILPFLFPALGGLLFSHLN